MLPKVVWRVCLCGGSDANAMRLVCVPNTAIVNTNPMVSLMHEPENQEPRQDLESSGRELWLLSLEPHLSK